MSAIIGLDGRSPPSVDEWYRAPAGERAEAFSTFLAYAGSYSVMPDRVIHHVDVASIQNWVNTDLVQMVKFAGETIISSPLPGGAAANTQIYELTWRRMANGLH
jgi:hypothetical protein